MASSAASISGIAAVWTAMPFHASTRPAPPASMIRISQNLMMRMIRALSRMSASCPASAESRKNGRMNSADAIAEKRASSASEL